MEVCGIVPARSGSVSIKNKNICVLDGKFLLTFPILTMMQCKQINRIIVTTDSERYAMIARGAGAETPFLRPPELSTDCPSEEPIIHAVKWLKEVRDYHPDLIVTAQCSTPLTTVETFNKCCKIMENQSYDSACAVWEAHPPPAWCFSTVYLLGNIYMKPYEKVKPQGDWGVRQTLPKLVVPTGGCYVTRTDYLLKERRIIGDRCYPVTVKNKLEALDIDCQEDLTILNALFKSGELDGWFPK